MVSKYVAMSTTLTTFVCNIDFRILCMFTQTHTGYSPHPGYGMMVQSEYPPNSYTAYGPAAAAAAAAAVAYQCGNPYASSVGPTGYPTPVSAVATASCYSMPPPAQHLSQLDKTSVKDR